MGNQFVQAFRLGDFVGGEDAPHENSVEVVRCTALWNLASTVPGQLSGPGAGPVQIRDRGRSSAAFRASTAGSKVERGWELVQSRYTISPSEPFRRAPRPHPGNTTSGVVSAIRGESDSSRSVLTDCLPCFSTNLIDADCASGADRACRRRGSRWKSRLYAPVHE